MYSYLIIITLIRKAYKFILVIKIHYFFFFNASNLLVKSSKSISSSLSLFPPEGLGSCTGVSTGTPGSSGKSRPPEPLPASFEPFGGSPPDGLSRSFWRVFERLDALGGVLTSGGKYGGGPSSKPNKFFSKLLLTAEG